MATVLTIVSQALRELNVLAAGETPTADEAEDGRIALNDLVDQWAAEELQIYSTTRTTWSLVSGTAAYTVGTGGTVNIVRPVYIDHVDFIDTTADPDLEYSSLTRLTGDDYSRIAQKALTSPQPQAWYYNPTFPLGTLTFWPVPTASGLQGAIYAPTAVPEFAALTTTVSLPPGYRRMIVKNLALELAPSYAKTQVNPLLVKQAGEAIASVKRANTQLMDLSFDPGSLIQGTGRFSYDINRGY